jgi:hypothetical protein
MSEVKTSSQISIRYEQSTIQLTTQFVMSASDEQLVLDCSSGPLLDEDKQQQVLPIHARHALPWSAARRLCESLQDIIRRHDQHVSQRMHAAKSVESTRHAGLARIEDAHVQR